MNELLHQGITAYKAGDKITARRLLGRATAMNTQDERAWLWLSAAVESDKERLTCLEKVLAINPNNKPAQRGLAALRRKQVKQSAKLPSSSPQFPITPSPDTATLNRSRGLDAMSSKEQEALRNLADLAAYELADGKNRKAVVAQLTKRGFPKKAVEQLVAQVARELNPVFIKKYRKRMIRGLLWAVAGIALTIGTYIFAEESGGTRFLIFYGAILWGLVDFLGGLVAWLTYRF